MIARPQPDTIAFLIDDLILLTTMCPLFLPEREVGGMHS